MTKTIDIIVCPRPDRHSTFETRVEGSEELLCITDTPLLTGARQLLARGESPDTVIVMRHAGSNHDALRSTIGYAAKLRVAENSGPRFRRFDPGQEWQARPPSDFEQRSDTRLAASEIISSRKPGMADALTKGNV